MKTANHIKYCKSIVVNGKVLRRGKHYTFNLKTGHITFKKALSE